MAIEPRRLCSGQVNPEVLDEAYRQHEMVLELAPHLLMISLLDCEPARLKAARAAHLRFRRDFDAELVGAKLQSFLLGVAPDVSRAEATSPVPG